MEARSAAVSRRPATSSLLLVVGLLSAVLGAAKAGKTRK